MQKDFLDFTITFRFLSESLHGDTQDLKQFVNHSESLLSWILLWRKNLSEKNKSFEEISDEMKKINPLIIHF